MWESCADLEPLQESFTTHVLSSLMQACSLIDAKSNPGSTVVDELPWKEEIGSPDPLETRADLQ